MLINVTQPILLSTYFSICGLALARVRAHQPKGGGRTVNLEQLIGRLKGTPSFMENVTSWQTIPAREAQYAPFPDGLDPRLAPVLAARGIHRLYTHQRQAFDWAREGKDICVVTPTGLRKNAVL